MMKGLKRTLIGGLATLALSGCGQAKEPKIEDYTSGMLIYSNTEGRGLRLVDENNDGIVDYIQNPNSMGEVILMSVDYKKQYEEKRNAGDRDVYRLTPVMSPELQQSLSAFYVAERKTALELDKFLYEAKKSK